jgi:hypothetical protein
MLLGIRNPFPHWTVYTLHMRLMAITPCVQPNKKERAIFAFESLAMPHASTIGISYCPQFLTSNFLLPNGIATWNVFSSTSVSSALSTIFSSRFLLLMAHSFHPDRSAPETTAMMSRDTEMRGRFDGDKGLSCSMRHRRHILIDLPPSL